MIDNDNDPVGLKAVKERAATVIPNMGLKTSTKVYYIEAGPGCGKSYAIRQLAAQKDCVPMDCTNLKSARDLPEEIARKLQKECEAGRVAGPFPGPPLPNLRLSPLGMVPKEAVGEYQLIHHLSYTRGVSVNDTIAPELWSIRYASLDHVVALIRACGHGVLMAKCDIQLAFCLLPVHPEDFCLLGF